MTTTAPMLPTGGVARRIVALLRAEPRRMWQPKQIARTLGLQESTVRKELLRILTRSEPAPIVALGHGWYRAFIDVEGVRRIEAPEPKLHAVQLGANSPLNRGWGPPRQGARWGSLGSRPLWNHVDACDQWMRDEEWRGRVVRFAVSPGTGSVQVSMRASENALAWREWEPFGEWVVGTLRAWGIVWTDAAVENLEMNLDYAKLAMGDVRRLRVQAFSNAWAQLYQKAHDVLRAEIRLHKLEDEVLSFSEAAGIIASLARPLPASTAESYVPPPADDYSPEVA